MITYNNIRSRETVYIYNKPPKLGHKRINSNDLTDKSKIINEIFASGII